MKQIRICEQNLAKLQAAISEVEGRASQRTVPAELLVVLVDCAENQTALRYLPKKEHLGAKVGYRMKIDLPNSYRWAPEYTHVQIVRRSSGWFLGSVHRLRGNNKQAEDIVLTASKEQDRRIVQRIRETYRVRADKSSTRRQEQPQAQYC